MLAVIFFPQSCLLLKIVFMFSMGPLLWAVPLWRNSLVFHDVDKARQAVCTKGCCCIVRRVNSR